MHTQTGRGGGILLANGDYIIADTEFLSNEAVNGGGVAIVGSYGWTGLCTYVCVYVVSCVCMCLCMCMCTCLCVHMFYMYMHTYVITQQAPASQLKQALCTHRRALILNL
jgi:hypothetical protein